MDDETDPASPRKLIQMVPRRDALEARVRALAVDTSNIAWSDHFWERAEERGFTTVDALRVLRTGHLEPDIRAGENAGEWKCKMTKRLTGHRETGVIVVVINMEGLLVATIEWEDL